MASHSSSMSHCERMREIQSRIGEVENEVEDGIRVTWDC
jgi:hypothetical protein